MNIAYNTAVNEVSLTLQNMYNQIDLSGMTDLPGADKENPGPWKFTHYGQNGYTVENAAGEVINHQRGGYDGDKGESRCREVVVEINQYVATAIGAMTNARELSREFFLRRRGFTDMPPRFTPDQAKTVAGAYRNIGKDYVADAISGVKYGKMLLRKFRKFLALSFNKRESSTHGYDGEILSSLLFEGYCTPDNLGISQEKMVSLFQEYNQHRVRVYMELCYNFDAYNFDAYNFDPNDVIIARTNLAFFLLSALADTGSDLSWLSDKDHSFVETITKQYGDAAKKNFREAAINARGFLQKGYKGQLLWKNVKTGIVAGGLSADDLELTPEEIDQLKKVF